VIFIHYTGYCSSGKTLADLNLRAEKGILNSTLDFPNKDGVGFFNSVLYKKKPIKKSVFNCNNSDWYGMRRCSYRTLIGRLKKYNIHTFITNSLSLLFSSRDTYRALGDGHEIKIVRINLDLKECRNRYLERCKRYGVKPLPDSFERYASEHENAIKFYKEIKHSRFELKNYVVDKIRFFDGMNKDELKEYLNGDYIEKLLKWGICS